MPHWYWDRKELRSTPSQLANMDYDTEMRYRREGSRFIVELGKEMKLSHTTMASGAVYFHRFYMFHSFYDFPKYVVATCCLFLAGKAEETPKKCRDIIRTVRTLTNDRQFATFGADPREEVMILERVLLQTIKFDLQVDHPYSSLIKYASCLKGDKSKLHKMVQMSWTFVNDSLCTTLCLQWEPEIVAIALMYLAVKLSKFEVKDWNDRMDWHKHWWDQYVENLDVEVLEDICHQVLDLYTQPPQTPAKEQAESPPPGARPSLPPALPTVAPKTPSSSLTPKPTPPLPREIAPPPLPRSHPHTPPEPPMLHPSTGSIGAPTVFQPIQPKGGPNTPNVPWGTAGRLPPPPLPSNSVPSRSTLSASPYRQPPPPGPQLFVPSYHPPPPQPAVPPPPPPHGGPSGAPRYPTGHPQVGYPPYY